MCRMQRGGIRGHDAQLPTAWQVAHDIPHRRMLSRQLARTGHLSKVHEGRRREISGGKRGCDRTKMRANRGHARGVIAVTLQLDATAVRKIVESMNRRVLIDAHR